MLQLDNDCFFDYSGLIPPMDIVIRMRGFEKSNSREQTQAEEEFCHRLIEELLVPLRKQIELETTVDLVVTVTTDKRKDERRISFYPNTANVEFFKDKKLYQVIVRREKVIGSIYDIQNDASLVRTYYVHKEIYDEYVKNIVRKAKNGVSFGDPKKKRRIIRGVERLTILQINQIIAQSVLRFRDEINSFIDDYFGDQEKPQIVGVFNRD